MSVWLLLTPALTWLLFATWGIHSLRQPPERLWRGVRITTAKQRFDPNNRVHRGLVLLIRLQGWLLLTFCIFITVMATLVAAGVISPASSE